MKYLIPISILASTLAASAVEIGINACPPAVKKSIEANLKGGRVDEINRITSNGTTRYVVEIDGPARRDITFRITPGGSIIFSSEDVSFAQCPPAVQTAIKKLLKVGWRVDDIDREITGKTVRFSVDIDRTGARDLDILLSNKGKVLKRTADKFD